MSKREAPLKYWAHPRQDEWVGTEAQLVNNGIIESHMLPGKPGRNKYSVTINGVRGQRLKNKNNENYIQIYRQGKCRFVVKKGISDAERERRNALPDIGGSPAEVTSETQRSAPKFQVGELVRPLDASGPRRITKIEWHDNWRDTRGNYLGPGYGYTLEPNQAGRNTSYTDKMLREYTPHVATVLMLPTAAKESIKQFGLQGPSPKSVVSISSAHRLLENHQQRLRRIKQDEELKWITQQIKTYDANR